MLRLALQMTMRDWRAGELRFLLSTLALAVASLSAVQFFTDRIGASLRRDAHGLLAADLRVGGAAPINPAWRAEASRRTLQTATLVELPAMVTAGEGDSAVSHMVSLKGASSGYPLRGTLTLMDGARIVSARSVPEPGTAWVDAAALSTFKLAPGARIQVGQRSLRIAAVIAAEPDQGPAVLTFSPRILINDGDLAATGLIADGAFAEHMLLAAGDRKAVAGFETWMRAELARNGGKGMRVETLADNGGGLGQALERAGYFLSLVGLLSTMLAAVAVAMAARRFTLRHAGASAMLRCLGLPARRILALYLLEFLLGGLAASVAGVLVGFASHFALIEWLGGLVSDDLAPPGWTPVASGIGAGVMLLLGFGLPPLLALRNVPHNRLLRGEAAPLQPLAAAAYAAGLAVFVGLLLWQANDLTIGAPTAAAFIFGLALFAAIARGALAGLRFIPVPSGAVWRLALADLRRRPAAGVTQVVALALGLMALLLLTIVRGDLLDAWKDTAPPDAPNHYIFQIQPDQRAAVAARLQPYGQPVLQPRIVARLRSVNGKQLRSADFPEGHAREMVEREHSLSASATLPRADTLVAGRWLGSVTGAPELSVADTSAKLLGLKLGDRVGFDIAGTAFEAPISSLRKIDKRSRDVGFAFMINPAAIEGMPTTWLAAVHVPASQATAVAGLAAEFPNLTVFNAGAMVEMFQRVLAQVSAAVEFLFLFTLASGLLVLYASLAASQDERMHQAALLRALGASRTQLAWAARLECALIGSLAGLLAAAGATAASWALARFAFELAWQASPLLVVAGFSAGALCAMAGGWVGLRAVLSQPPLRSLRAQ